MHVSAFTPHQCSFVHTQIYDDPRITYANVLMQYTCTSRALSIVNAWLKI